MNETIDKARRIGLDLLQAKQKDIDHGLELHRHALVVESYGFSPRGAIDADRVNELAAAGASDYELRETMEEMGLISVATDEHLARQYRDALDDAGVDCIFQNAGEEGQSALQLLKRLGNFTYVTDMLGDFMHRAATPDDIPKAKELGKHCLYLSGNGVPLREEWKNTSEELRYVRTFFQLGVRMMHLTYNRRNMLGDGCAEKTDAGLSDFGEAAVREMNRVGVLVDVAHSGWQTCIDAAHISAQPIVASHSGAHALNGHIRCKTDEVMRAIVDKGGTVGVCCIPAFLGLSGDINAFLDHIDYIAGKFGADTVTIGTDVAYTPAVAAQARQKLTALRSLRPRFEAFWPVGDPLFDAQWKDETKRQSLAWSNWPIFTVGLVQRGYSDDDIQKILGGNILRVARQAFQAAH